MPPRSRLGFHEETQNYAKRNRSQIFFLDKSIRWLCLYIIKTHCVSYFCVFKRSLLGVKICLSHAPIGLLFRGKIQNFRWASSSGSYESVPPPGITSWDRKKVRKKVENTMHTRIVFLSGFDHVRAGCIISSFLIPSWKLSFKATEKVTLYYGGIKGSLSLEPRGVFIDISVCYLLRGIDSRRDGTSRSQTNASSLESTKRRRARATKHTTRRQRICGENVTQWHRKR